MIRIKNNVAIRDMTSAISAYDTAPVVPMTAPVIRFSRRAPVSPVIIIPAEAMATDAVIARRNPTITMLC